MMLVNPDNPFIQLLQLLGCDLTQPIHSWFDVSVLFIAGAFGSFMLFLLFKFLYGMMCRMFRGRW